MQIYRYTTSMTCQRYDIINSIPSWSAYIRVYIWLERIFQWEIFVFQKVYSWRRKRISFNGISYRIFVSLKPSWQALYDTGIFCYCFLFSMALQGSFLQRQMFRWCSNERVKWLEKENIMKLGANVTCQITDVFMPALSMWLPQQELCFLWWQKTH